MVSKLVDAFNKTKNSKKLIHCITNPISINMCANAVLALGNKPIMAQHPKEVCDITLSSDALLINLGNITDVRMKSIKISAKAAKINGIPAIFDVVGIACSKLRRGYAKKLIKNYTPDVIKGNYSEIYALYEDEYNAKGVDSEEFNVSDIAKASVYLANKFNCVILASGKTDIVASKEKFACINNGVKQLSDITGTGCMLGSIVASFMASNSAYSSAVLGCGVLGIAGEAAEAPDKNGSFMVKLIDELSSLDDMSIKSKIKMQENIS